MWGSCNPYAASRWPAENDPPQRALDELAAALHAMRGARRRPRPRRIVRSIKLSAQFPGDFSPADWRKLAAALGVAWPSLTPVVGGWEFPGGWLTVFDLAAELARQRPEWEPPEEFDLPAWVNAQIFAGVRDCLCDATGLPPERIYREASLVNDLGLD